MLKDFEKSMQRDDVYFFFVACFEKKNIKKNMCKMKSSHFYYYMNYMVAVTQPDYRTYHLQQDPPVRYQISQRPVGLTCQSLFNLAILTFTTDSSRSQQTTTPLTPPHHPPNNYQRTRPASLPHNLAMSASKGPTQWSVTRQLGYQLHPLPSPQDQQATSAPPQAPGLT